MKKLLIATDTYFPKKDGVTTFLYYIVPKLTKYYKVTIIAPNYGKENTLKNIKVIKIPLSRLELSGYKGTKVNKNLIRQIVRGQDIVFIQSLSKIGRTVLRAAKEENKKTALYMHVIESQRFPENLPLYFFKGSFRTFLKRYEKSIFEKFDLVISSRYGIEYLKRTKIKTKKTVVPLGVDNKRFFPINNREKQRLKEKFNLKGKFILGYSGRLSKEKDLPTLKNAFLKLKKEFPNLFLLIIGNGPERKIFSKMKEVKITGFVENPEYYLRLIDIYIIPSLIETGSLSLLEAIASGLAIVTTNVGYATECIKNGYNGFIFDRKDVKQLTEILRKLIKDKKLRKKIANNVKKISKKFRWEKTAEGLRKLLNKL